jgi:hypothetical protein
MKVRRMVHTMMNFRYFGVSNSGASLPFFSKYYL